LRKHEHNRRQTGSKMTHRRVGEIAVKALIEQSDAGVWKTYRVKEYSTIYGGDVQNCTRIYRE
jgi:hypothetical protein